MNPLRFSKRRLLAFFEKIGESLKQLFRAEWDNYPQQLGYNHPQPHWHFTEQLNNNEKSFADLENEEEDSIFSGLQEQDNRRINLLGDWASNGNMVNKVEEENIFVEWLIQLFAHVRGELTYKDGINDFK